MVVFLSVFLSQNWVFRGVGPPLDVHTCPNSASQVKNTIHESISHYIYSEPSLNPLKQLYGLDEVELMVLLEIKKKLEDDTIAEGMKKLAEEMKKLEDTSIPENTKAEETTVNFLRVEYYTQMVTGNGMLSSDGS